jgi:hypothetical protein
LHNDFVVYFHEYAPTPIPKSGLAVAVARAGTGDHVRQAQLAAGETDIDELVVWQVKLSHHRLPIGTTKAQPLLLAFHVCLGTTQDCRQGYRRKRHFPGSSYRPNNTIPAFNSSYQTEVAPNDFLISSDNTRRALRSRAHLREEPDTTPACKEKKSVLISERSRFHCCDEVL